MIYVNDRLFGRPGIQDFIGLLFLPHRGLFISSPVLVFAIPGAVLFFKERLILRDACTCLLISAGFLVFIASFYSWGRGLERPSAIPAARLPFCVCIDSADAEKVP